MITPRQCKAARGLLGYTQEQLANEAHISKTGLNNFESGKTAIKSSTAESIASALQSGGVEFIEGEGVRLRQDRVEILRGDNSLVQLWDDIFYTLKEDGGEVLIRNVSEEDVSEAFSEQLSNHLKRLIEHNISERIIVPEGTHQYPMPNITYKTQPKEIMDTATTSCIYKNKVSFHIWNEETILLITSDHIASAERARFEKMWQDS